MISTADECEAPRDDQSQDPLTPQLNHAKVVTTLRASSESRNLHLAKLSHEFRTPLQIIVANVDLLSAVLGNNQNSTVSSSIASLNSACEQLLSMSNDLADYLKGSSTQIMLRYETVNLIEFLSACVAMHSPMANAKGLSIRLKHDEVDLDCWTDAARLRQIMTNLIGNAVKYTTHGSIDLECRKEADGRTLIVVRDTGSGISEEGQKSIFEPWFRADETKQGFGLGLAIVKATADAIGAKVLLKSTLGVGTEMTLVLPAKKAKRPK
jgi:signal transduction histidine kinase